MLFAFLLATMVAQATPEPVPTLSPTQLLARVRAQFRSHRPPPAFESYTIERKQMRNDGYPDVSNSYVFHVWIRNSDRAALKRQVFRDDYEYPPQFDRPAFNEERDPGPPTADIFEPKPARPHPASEPYTPEPAAIANAPVIGRVQSLVEFDYRVTNVQYEGNLLHLTLAPINDPDRNRLRELYADKDTFELVKLVATDTLFILGPQKDTFAALFTMTMGVVQGVPVVTHIHGVIGRNASGLEYQDDGKLVDFDFRDINFPATLPDWYFNARTYGAHQNDLPE
jgi:hypothetical protein